MNTLLWSLIALQLFMGAADTLIHHELSERLAWRMSQQKEIRIHGIRNLFYAVIFAGLGLFSPQGLFAAILGFILAAELVITLIDFVEEDKTRKLPASERVLHTLMALNYGAILFGLLPLILEWAALPAALPRVDHGLWGLMMIAAALAVFIFGLRDLHASARLNRLALQATIIPLPTSAPKNILITGGTGFIGKALLPALQHAGHNITLLTRNVANAAHVGAPVSLITDLDQIKNEASIDVIINLAGAPIAALWTKAHKRDMLSSRVRTTQNLQTLITRLAQKPSLLISGSAIGIYGKDAASPLTETRPIIDDGSFAQKLCLAWEKEAAASGLRTVLLRTGIVLDPSGGTLAQLLVPTELGGGAVLGTGRQMMSWISRRDIVRLIGHIMNAPNLSGPVNAAAPFPVSNHAFTKSVATSLHRPTVIRIPAFILKALGGLGEEIFLGSQHVLPEKAVRSGFTFLDPELPTALDRMLGKYKRGSSYTAPVSAASQGQTI